MTLFSNTAHFRRLLSAARGYAQMSRPDLGRELGVHPSTVQRWEAGTMPESLQAREHYAQRVVRATECPAGWFEMPELLASDDLRREMTEQVVELTARVASARKELEERLSRLEHPENQERGNDS